MKQRQRLILEALLNCGGRATTLQIASKTKLHINGITQSLGSLTDFVRMGKPVSGGNQTWRLCKKLPQLTRPLWKKLNARRLKLINKKFGKKITAEEATELFDLQNTTDRYLNRLDQLSMGPALRRARQVLRQLRQLS